MNRSNTERLRAAVRSSPDRPKPGVIFRDITPVLGDAGLFHLAMEELVTPFLISGVRKVAAIDARGFIFGGAAAQRLSAGFVPVRKKGKLPGPTVSAAYDLEYGRDELEIHTDSLTPGERVLLVDDLIATGGTAEAAVQLLRSLGADLVGACFFIDLADLGGADKLRALGLKVHTLVPFGNSEGANGATGTGNAPLL